MMRRAAGGWALMSGVGAVLVALLMVGSAGAASAGAAITVSPAYKGSVLPQNSIYVSGCHTKVSIKKFKFDLHTGVGSGATAGKTGSCGRKAPQNANYADASSGGGFQALVKLPKIPSTASNITANFDGKWTTSIAATDGGSPTCNSGQSIYFYNYTYYEWNYTYNGYYYYFADYYYSYQYSYYGYTYNYSYGNAVPPSPFPLNATTYYYHDAYYSVYGSCDAYASMYYDLYGYLYDSNTGSQSFYSGASTPYYGGVNIGVENYTDWGWDNYTYWYGPGNSSYGYPTTFFNYNSSLTSYYNSYSYSYTGGYTYNYTTGTSNSTSASNTTKLAGTSMWWTGTFSPTDQYYVIVQLYLNAYAYNDNWVKGGASYVVNAATAGNGIKLGSITIS